MSETARPAPHFVVEHVEELDDADLAALCEATDAAIDAHLVKARTAAGFDFTGTLARLCVAPLLVMILWRTLFGKFDTEPYDYQGLIETHISTLLKGLSAEGAA